MADAITDGLQFENDLATEPLLRVSRTLRGVSSRLSLGLRRIGGVVQMTSMLRYLPAPYRALGAEQHEGALRFA